MASRKVKKVAEPVQDELEVNGIEVEAVDLVDDPGFYDDVLSQDNPDDDQLIWGRAEDDNEPELDNEPIDPDWDPEVPVSSEPLGMDDIREAKTRRPRMSKALREAERAAKAERRAAKAAEKAQDPTMVPGLNRTKRFNITSYEEAKNLGEHLASNIDENWWAIGDMALEIPVAEYGKRTTETWAKDIGLSKGTIIKARWMARIWEPEERGLFPTLHRGHYQLVTKLAYVDKEEAMAWLEKAAMGDKGDPWSVDAFSAELRGTPVERIKPIVIPHATIGEIFDEEDLCVIEIRISGQSAQDWITSLKDNGVLDADLKVSFLPQPVEN